MNNNNRLIDVLDIRRIIQRLPKSTTLIIAPDINAIQGTHTFSVTIYSAGRYVPFNRAWMQKNRYLAYLVTRAVVWETVLRRQYFSSLYFLPFLHVPSRSEPTTSVFSRGFPSDLTSPSDDLRADRSRYVCPWKNVTRKHVCRAEENSPCKYIRCVRKIFLTVVSTSRCSYDKVENGKTNDRCCTSCRE